MVKSTNLLSKNGFDVRNSSILVKPANKERFDKGLVKDSTIERLLRMKISWAGTVIVLVGKETHTREDSELLTEISRLLVGGL